MVAHWLTISAVATRLGCSVERVQELADSGALHAELLHHDHMAVSEASVDAYLAAPELFAADDEDFMSGLLAGHPDTERVVPVRGGPALDLETEAHYDEERRT